MIKRKIVSRGILAGLLTGLLFFSGCIPVSTGETPGEGGFNWTSVVMVVILFALFYFLIMRPQNKRRKEQQKMTAELKPGNRVITAGGIYGEIESIDEESVVLKVESGAKIRVMKQGLMIK